MSSCLFGEILGEKSTIRLCTKNVFLCLFSKYSPACIPPYTKGFAQWTSRREDRVSLVGSRGEVCRVVRFHLTSFHLSKSTSGFAYWFTVKSPERLNEFQKRLDADYRSSSIQIFG